MYSRSAKGGEKGDPNRNPWLAKMGLQVLFHIVKAKFPIPEIFHPSFQYAHNKMNV
jgi:hypothetical protein